jgi:5'-AMP-activated protein kinase catalytic alpha subunit
MAAKNVGRYRLTTYLGKGTYGDVRLAEHLGTKELFACKCISREMLDKNETQSTLLQREIRIMKSLSHENVVKLFEVLQTPNNIYLIVELVRGGDLRRAMDRGPTFDEDRARTYFQHLICALYYVHNQGVAHRDIKPDNLLLTEKNVLKVADFGLSQGDCTESMGLVSLCGTPNYVAPEVLKLKSVESHVVGYNGFKADVWSCGVVLFEMLAGFLPFQADTTRDLMELILTGTYTVPESLSDEAQDLLHRMLEVDPELRISVKDITNHVWFTVNFDRTGLRAGLRILSDCSSEGGGRPTSGGSRVPTEADGEAFPCSTSVPTHPGPS